MCRDTCVCVWVISEGTNPALWDDLTDQTQLTFIDDCVSFNTNVSGRYWNHHFIKKKFFDKFMMKYDFEINSDLCIIDKICCIQEWLRLEWKLFEIALKKWVQLLCSAYLNCLFFCFKVHADGLSKCCRCLPICNRTLPRGHHRSLHGSFCRVCQANWRRGGKTSYVLHDRRPHW